jgi:translation initiation factor IF-3
VRPAEPRTRVNETIRVPQVRLIDDDGSQIGVKARDEALEYAWAKNLDLVEVAPDANPPVCRVMDYGKYRYDQEQKQKLARKHQSTITIKEIKLRPKIDPHDYATKKGHVVRFLRQRDKVKVTIMFRGREMSHPERGRALLERLAEDVSELGVIESAPIQDGRNMVMLLAPVREIADAKPEPAPAKQAKPAATPEAATTDAEPAAAAEAEAPAATPDVQPDAAPVTASETPAAAPEATTETPEATPEATTTEQPAAAPKAAKVLKEAAPKAKAEAKPATPRKKPAAKAKPAAATAEPADDVPAAAAPEPTST